MTARVSPEEMSEKEGAYHGPPAPQPVLPHQVTSTAQPGIATVNPTYANATYNASANYGVPTGQAVCVTAASSAQPMQPPTYTYVMAQQVQQPLSRAERSASTCWFVVGILSAIFCCLPFGVVGAITAFLSREDAEKGDAVGHRRRLCQAKGFTSAAIGVGLLAILSVAISLGLIFSLARNEYHGYDYDDLPDIQRWTDEGIYLGCYQDYSDASDLDMLYTYFGAANSVSKCVKYCSDHGYKYAGLQYGTACHCGNSYGIHGKLDESKCNSVCKGDGRECGGYTENSVYRTNYLGCFNDSAFDSLEGNPYSMPYNEATPETCVDHCGSLGFEFAGVNYDMCYCGMDPNRYGETSAAYCNSPCAGDFSLTCGGSDKNSVYKTEYEGHLRYNFLGCYKDNAFSRDLSEYYEYFGLDTSIEKCVDTCAFQGYKYAGIQNGSTCYCSNSYGLYSKSFDTECAIFCPIGLLGCGGVDKNSVFRTSYIGCFEDEWIRALNDSVWLVPGELTPSACISECENKGYLFAGTQNGNECYCGHDMNRYREAPAYECRTPCAGDYKSVCGGSFRNSVYRTTLAQVVY